MNDQIKRSVASDLVIGFGFSKANAEIALAMYITEQLEPEEDNAIEYIIRENPFGRARGQPHIILDKGMIGVLEHLNYRITMKNGR